MRYDVSISVTSSLMRRSWSVIHRRTNWSTKSSNQSQVPRKASLQRYSYTLPSRMNQPSSHGYQAQRLSRQSMPLHSDNRHWDSVKVKLHPCEGWVKLQRMRCDFSLSVLAERLWFMFRFGGYCPWTWLWSSGLDCYYSSPGTAWSRYNWNMILWIESCRRAKATLLSHWLAAGLSSL